MKQGSQIFVFLSSLRLIWEALRMCFRTKSLSKILSKMLSRLLCFLLLVCDAQFMVVIWNFVCFQVSVLEREGNEGRNNRPTFRRVVSEGIREACARAIGNRKERSCAPRQICTTFCQSQK